MKTYSPLFLLAALGLLSGVDAGAAAPDTSEWKCASCPYPKGSSGSLEAGIAHVSADSARFGDYRGWDEKGAKLVLDARLSHRTDTGYFADLALDSQSLVARSGHEGRYTLRLSYAELSRSLIDDARTPFLGSGTNVLTLPAGAGFPAAGTSTMPLGTTLQGLDLGYKRKSYGLSAVTPAVEHWQFGLSFKRDVRDGTRPTSAAFFSTASQLAMPLDQTTDQFEAKAAYGRGPLQASLGLQVSKFSNGVQALTWDNPFWPVIAGATRAQLALAPDNTLQQVVGSVAYALSPTLRFSGDFAAGRLTQDAAFLETSLNTALAAQAGPLPAASLDGKVDTFNGNLRFTATPAEGLRLNASYSRNVRDNKTAVHSWAQVSNDIFVDPASRGNTPFSTFQDRYKLSADYRAGETTRLSAGVEEDDRERSYTEVVTTREATVWGRVTTQLTDYASVALKLARAQRHHSDYGVATWFGSPENPLLRKYNLAQRHRNSASLRLDLSPAETVSMGFTMDYANDDYLKSIVGLNIARNHSLGADVAWAVSEGTQLTAFSQGEWITSRQSGSEAYASPDWRALSRDRFLILGLGVRHALIADKLDVGADYTLTRTRSEIAVDNAGLAPGFPATTARTDTIKLFASYKLQDQLTLNGSLWYEHYDAEDWRLDGVLPATVQNLLAFGQQAPRYHVGVVQLSVRYRY